MVRYCPVCGKEDSKIAFLGELCENCAKTKVGDFPTVRISVCTKCGALLDKARKDKKVKVEDEIIRILKLKQTDATYDPIASAITYDSSFGRITQPVLVLTEKMMCMDCGRAGTQYFEAIVQLRGPEKRVMMMADWVIKRIESRSFVPKVLELKEGIDIYCGSRNEAIAALNQFDLSYVRTEKLAGERNGKRLYRTTLLVRL
ncbi:MAG: NMD3-related protein [Candidatus Micrarchaeota archaeon]|nr:NMD3-related protein [Candidatus Micrarchaeota archaeon]